MIYKINKFLCISTGTRLGTHKMRVLLIWYDTTKGNKSALVIILGAGLAALSGHGIFSVNDRGKTAIGFIFRNGRANQSVILEGEKGGGFQTATLAVNYALRNLT